RTGAGIELERTGELGAEVLHADADPGALHPARAQDLLGRAAREVRGDREADAAPAPDDHRIDPEDLPLEVAERPARGAGVDARSGLEIVLDRVPPQAAAPLRAEDAGGHGVAEAERRADRDDPLADARRVAVRELRGDEPRRVDFDDREIRLRIA